MITISASYFVNVTAIVAAAGVDRFGFGNYAHVAQHNITTNRLDGPFTSIDEVEEAGFTEVASEEIYHAATAAFGVENGVESFYIGRRIPSAGGPFDAVFRLDASGPTYTDLTTAASDATAANVAVFPGTEAVGDIFYVMSAVPFTSITFNNTGGTQGVDGGSLAVAKKYYNGVAWTALSGVTDNTSNFTAAVGSQTFTFTQPVDWAPVSVNSSDPLYAVAFELTAGAYSTNPTYDTVKVSPDASWTAALSQIEATSDEFYGFTTESRVKADIELIAPWAEARFKRYVPQSADPDYLSGTAGNVGLVLKAAGYKRTMGPIYHAVSSGSANGYADVAMASRGFGFDLDRPRGHDNWMFQVLQGITPDSITGPQMVNIWNAGGNVYIRSLGQMFTSKGTAAAGEPYFQDTQTVLDWFTRRAQEDLLQHLLAVRPDYDNTGIQGCRDVVQARLDMGVPVGAFSGDFPRTVTVPDISEISPATRQTRVLAIQCDAVFKNKINALDLTLYVQF